jgi:predicted GH43/DUF377 family glycosyl hydrolase
MRSSRSAIILLLLVLSSCNHFKRHMEDNVAPDSWALMPFVKADSSNPILMPDTSSFYDPVWKKRIAWEKKDVFNPAIVVKDGKVMMLYRAQDTVGLPGGTSRIGLAESVDGIHFTRSREPVLFPDNDAFNKYEWQGGCEDPRIVEDGQGTYYMTYTAYDGKVARLLVASSKDLHHWTKHGPVFTAALGGKYLNKWSKSGSIVSTYVSGKIHWTPVEMQAGEKPYVPLKNEALNMPDLKIVVATRNKKFDSDLVESGPPAMITEAGILLIYNSRNLKNIGDTSLPDGTYAAGQVLIDKSDPTKVIRRLDENFMQPDKPYELTGQVNRVCFVEGLAQFKGKWFLYYGTADSKIAVAVKN